MESFYWPGSIKVSMESQQITSCCFSVYTI